MKYHIDFDNDNRLSFEILDNPAAQTWARIVKTSLEDETSTQKIFRSVFPAEEYEYIAHFNQMIHFYEEFVKLGGEDISLNKNINSYSHDDYINLDRIVNLLFYKAINHNIYYASENKMLLRRYAKRIYRYKEQLLDCIFKPEESYATIKFSNHAEDFVIPRKMRYRQWKESIRSNLVIRLWPNFDLRSLDILERRNDPLGYSDSRACMHFITSDHRICFYDNEIQTQKEADIYQTTRMSKIIDFVGRNRIDVVPGDIAHSRFTPPVVAECINKDDYTVDQLRELFMNYEKVSITIED